MLRIGEKRVGSGQAVFIIAEAGVNHNGDRDTAFQLVDIASKSGADAVKFQNFKAETLATKNAKKNPYQIKNTNNSLQVFYNKFFNRPILVLCLIATDAKL